MDEMVCGVDCLGNVLRFCEVILRLGTLLEAFMQYFNQGNFAVCGHFDVICHHHDERMVRAVLHKPRRRQGQGARALVFCLWP